MTARSSGVRQAKPIPIWADRFFPATLLTIALIAGAGLGQFVGNQFDFIMDVVLISICLSLFPHLKSPAVFILTGVLIFILVANLSIVWLDRTAPMLEALRSYKWIIFLSLLCFVVGRRVRSAAPFVIATKVIILCALVKYGVTVALNGFQSRPQLFAENNFEIALFCGLVAVTYRHLGRFRLLFLLSLCVTVTLSASRSGIVTLGILIVFLTFRDGLRAKPMRQFAGILFLIVVIVVAYTVFQDRADGSTIDRVHFLNVFTYETQTWSPVNWAFGTWPITGLSTSGCASLAYYAPSFALGGEGASCYSAIFHAFVLRVIFDMGIFGLLLAFGSVWWLMSVAKVNFALRLTLTGIALANSLSVSGLNNSYVVLPIVVAVIFAPISLKADQGLLKPDRVRLKGKVLQSKNLRLKSLT